MHRVGHAEALERIHLESPSGYVRLREVTRKKRKILDLTPLL